MANSFKILYLALTIAIISVKTEADGVCRPLWTQFQGRCYRFFGGPKSFEDAEYFCRQFVTRLQSAHLVSIHNLEENNFVYELWQTSVIAGLDVNDFESRVNRVTSLWIGLEDRDTEGTFKWLDSTSVNFRHWRSGEPNNSGWSGNEPHGEDCISLFNIDGIKDEWNDAPCDRLLPFVCNMPTE